jgi:hypothetical protein
VLERRKDKADVNAWHALKDETEKKLCSGRNQHHRKNVVIFNKNWRHL